MNLNIWVTVLVYIFTLLLSCHDITAVVDSEVDGITFYDVRGIFSTAHTPVLDIESDLQQQDSLLIADYNSLKVLDRNNIEHLIVGQTNVSGFRDGQGAQALFTWITSFIQLSRSEVLAVDYYNHCIRSVDRNSNTTTTFAGICENGGHGDQNLALSRFYNPYDIVQSPSSSTVFYVSDEFNNAVRRLSGNTVTSMAINGVLSKPRGLALDQPAHNLYVTIRHGIVKMRISTGSVTALTRSSSGHADGPVATSMFSNPYMIKRLTLSIFVVADYGNNLVRLIDTSNSRVTSICTGIKGRIDGSIHNCQLYEPYSVEVLIDNKKILIGQWGDLKALQFQFSNQTTTSTSTTAAATKRPKTTTKVTTKVPETSSSYPTEIVTASNATTPFATSSPSKSTAQTTTRPKAASTLSTSTPASFLGDTTTVIVSVVVPVLLVILVLAGVFYLRCKTNQTATQAYQGAEAQNNLPPNQPPVNPAHHLPYAPDEGAAVYFRPGTSRNVNNIIDNKQFINTIQENYDHLSMNPQDNKICQRPDLGDGDNKGTAADIYETIQ